MYAVLQYIREHIQEKLTLDSLSVAFGYSKWYLSRRFREEMQISITEYIRRNRIQLSALALIQGEKVIDVANQFGYDSVGGFNKAFLKEYGCYPQDYKKEYTLSKQRYEERRDSMVSITDRVYMLREAAIENRYSDTLFCLRDFWFAKGVLSCSADADPYTARMESMAAGLCAVLENSPCCIFPEELIVGYNYADGAKEYSWHSDDTLREWQKTSLLSAEDMEWYIANRGKAAACTGVPRQEHAIPVWGLYASQLGERRRQSIIAGQCRLRTYHLR